MKESIRCIPLAWYTLDSLDIFNLVLIVLRPCLTGALFDLILKFRAALTRPAFPLLFPLRRLFFCLLPVLSVQLVFIYTLMCVSTSLGKSVCAAG